MGVVLVQGFGHVCAHVLAQLEAPWVLARCDVIIGLDAIAGWTFGGVVGIDVMQFLVGWETSVKEFVDTCCVLLVQFVYAPLVGCPADHLRYDGVPIFSLYQVLAKTFTQVCGANCVGFLACDRLACDVQHRLRLVKHVVLILPAVIVQCCGCLAVGVYVELGVAR